ncbi:MAG: MFS transporter [Chloroflexi bacterium]|nr:MFS transporter [Chloroflexota bacterium]
MKADLTTLSPWRVLLPVGFGTALSLIGDSTLYTVLPTQAENIGLTLAAVGVLLSLNRFVRLGANGLAGWLCDRFSKRPLFITSLLLGAVSSAIFAFTTYYPLLIIARLLWGIAWSGIWVAGNGLILDFSQTADRGRWIGNYHASFFLGAALGAFLGGGLTDWLGFAPAMGVAAGLNFLGTIVAWLFMPQIPIFKPFSAPSLESAIEISSNAIPKKVNENSRGQLITAVSLLGINRLVIAGILSATMGLYLQQTVGNSWQIGQLSLGVATLTGLALGTTILVSMFVTPIMGRFSDRTNSRWQAVAVGLLPGVLGFVVLAFGLPGYALLGLPLTSVSSSSNQSLSTAITGDLSQGRRGRALAILYTAGDFGSAIGPPLAYNLIAVLQVTQLYLGCAVLLFVMWGTAVYWTKRSNLAAK